MRLILTQSTARTDGLRRRLAERGHDTFLLPFSAIVDSPCAPSAVALQAAMQVSDCVIPVSPTAVEKMLSAWFERVDPVPWPSTLDVAVVGPGSLRQLDARFPAAMLDRVIRPSRAPYDAQHLLDEPLMRACAGLRLLVLRGEVGNDVWIDTLRQRGADVTVLGLYRNAMQIPSDRQCAALVNWLGLTSADRRVGSVGSSDHSQEAPVWWFSHVKNAICGCAWLQSTGQSALLEQHRAWAIHARIAQTLIDHGWHNVSLVEPGEAALLAAIESAG